MSGQDFPRSVVYHVRSHEAVRRELEQEGLTLPPIPQRIQLRTRYDKCAGKDGHLRRLVETKRRRSARHAEEVRTMLCNVWFDEEPEADDNPFGDYIA